MKFEIKKVIYVFLLIFGIGSVNITQSCSCYYDDQHYFLESQIITTIAGVTLMSSIIYFLHTAMEMTNIERAAKIKWYKVLACIKQDQIDAAFDDEDDDI